MKEKKILEKTRKVVLNKYSIALFVFTILLVFVGEQSLLNQFIRQLEIRKIKREIIQTRSASARAEQILQSLNNADSLERFAREQYNMHAKDETVYLVD